MAAYHYSEVVSREAENSAVTSHREAFNARPEMRRSVSVPLGKQRNVVPLSSCVALFDTSSK